MDTISDESDVIILSTLQVKNGAKTVTIYVSLCPLMCDVIIEWPLSWGSNLLRTVALGFNFWFSSDLRPDVKRKKARQEIKRSAIFQKQADSKEKLAMHLAGLANRKKNIVTDIKSNYFKSTTTNVVIGRKNSTERERLSSGDSDDVLDSRVIKGKSSDYTSRDYKQKSIESQEETRQAKTVGIINVAKVLDSTNELLVTNEPGNVGAPMEVKSPGSVQDQSVDKRGKDDTNEVFLEEANRSNSDVFSSCKAPEKSNYKRIVITNSNNSLVAEYGSSSDESEGNVNIG